MGKLKRPSVLLFDRIAIRAFLHTFKEKKTPLRKGADRFKCVTLLPDCVIKPGLDKHLCDWKSSRPTRRSKNATILPHAVTFGQLASRAATFAVDDIATATISEVIPEKVVCRRRQDAKVLGDDLDRMPHRKTDLDVFFGGNIFTRTDFSFKFRIGDLDRT